MNRIYNLLGEYMNLFKVLNVLLFVIIIFLAQCSSGAKRLNANRDLVADSGGLTRQEMEEAAAKFADSIQEHFKKNPPKDGVFVALLPTKNDTSEEIPTSVFDNSLVDSLRKRGIYTVRVENRKDALEELKRNQEGLTNNTSAGTDLKSPNFFVAIKIDESVFKNSGNKIVEQVINIELRSTETTLVAWSDHIPIRKQAKSRNGIDW